MRILIALLLFVSPALAGSCRDDYEALAARTISTLADYIRLENDFRALNAKHAPLVAPHILRMPPHLQYIPVTPNNFADKAADIQKVARVRQTLAWCP